jgi:hypothetical protein
MKKIFFNIYLFAALVPVHGAWAAVDECGKAAPKKPCQIIIDRTAPVSGKSVTVENETQVALVLIKKSPFESCKNEVKREDLPDVSPLPTLLSLIKDVAGPLVLPFGGPAPTTPEDLIAQELDSIANFAQNQADTARALQKGYEAENENLKKFYRTKYFRKEYAGGSIRDETQFEEDRLARQTAVNALTNQPLPNTAAGEITYKSVARKYAAYVRSSGATPAMISLLEDKINRARIALDTLAKAVSTLDAAHTKMLSTLDYLKFLKDPDWEISSQIHPDRNAKVTGSFSCSSDLSGKPTLDPPIVYTISFQDTPRLSLSAGVLLSTVPRNSVGLESVVDDRTANNTVTAHAEIRDHPAKPQVVPFSFINVRLGRPWPWAGRNMTFNFAPGVGVNPNNGGNAAEFFLGLSLGFGNVFVAAGSHVGHELRPANNYHLLDRPPADLKVVPTETPWKPGFGFAVSYRIPLK